MADEILARLNSIEQRLLRLEAAAFRPDLAPSTPARVAPIGPAPAPAAAARRESAGVPLPQRPASTERPIEPAGTESTTITSVLGWAGAVAFVLAAAYLIRAAIDAGWLTPSVQIAGAALFGVALIAVAWSADSEPLRSRRDVLRRGSVVSTNGPRAGREGGDLT